MIKSPHLRPVLPPAFISRLSAQFPKEHQEIIDALDRPPNASVLLNPEKQLAIATQGLESATDNGSLPIPRLAWLLPIDWCPHGRILSARPSFTLDPLFHAGCYYAQESSSMFLWHILSTLNYQLFPDSYRDINCLDLCAAPGGKSLLLSSYFDDKAKIISNEVIPQRNAVLRENVTKWGAANVIVTRNNPADFSSLENYFDLVLIDAPCSGEGMFRKDHRARNEWSEENVRMCSVRQRRILNDVLGCVSPGGYLIYSTCTFSSDENEENCRWLCGLGLEKVMFDVPKNWNLDVLDEKEFFAVRMLPHRVAGEGFFVSVFRVPAKEQFPHREVSGRRREEKRSGRFTNASNRENEIASKWMQGKTGLVMDSKEDALFLSSFHFDELNHLSKQLHITLPGIEVGRLVRDELIPAHALAVSGLVNENISRIVVNEETALRYLRGENISSSVENISTEGWALMAFNEHPLGWIKIMKNRVNNYYPKNWRVRMR